MRPFLKTFFFIVALAAGACATTQQQTPMASRTIVKRTTVAWNCPPGSKPDPMNHSPNCALTTPLPQAAEARVIHAPAQPQIDLSKRVAFQPASAKLTEAQKAALQDIAETVRADPKIVEIRIIGSADSTGQSAFNEKLSQERAEAVKSYLEEQGVSPKLLDAHAVGDTLPVATNDSAQGRTINRSALIVALKRAG